MQNIGMKSNSKIDKSKFTKIKLIMKMFLIKVSTMTIFPLVKYAPELKCVSKTQ